MNQELVPMWMNAGNNRRKFDNRRSHYRVKPSPQTTRQPLFLCLVPKDSVKQFCDAWDGV